MIVEKGVSTKHHSALFYGTFCTSTNMHVFISMYIAGQIHMVDSILTNNGVHPHSGHQKNLPLKTSIQIKIELLGSHMQRWGQGHVWFIAIHSYQCS